MDQLPNELLSLVFRSLPLEARARLERVCKKWKEMLQKTGCQPPVLLHILTSESKALDSDEFPHFCLYQPRYRSENWEYLQLTLTPALHFLRKYCTGSDICLRSQSENCISQCLTVIGEHWKNITCLEIEHLSDHGVRHTVEWDEIHSEETTSKITRLQTDGSLNVPTVDYKQCKALSGLRSLELRNIHTGFITGIVKHLPSQLTTLWIPWNWETHGGTFLPELSHKFGSSMENLSVGWSPVREVNLIVLGFPNLVSLDLLIPGSFPLPYLRRLQTLTKLRNIGIRYSNASLCSDTTDFRQEKGVTQNFEINLACCQSGLGADCECYNFDDDGIECMEPPPTASEDISVLFEGRTNIESLALCCTFDAARGLESLAKNCPNIQRLRLSCESMRPYSMEPLECLEKLSLLEVAVTDSNFETLTRFIGHSKAVKNYSLRCTGVSSRNLYLLFKALNLKARKEPKVGYKLNLRTSWNMKLFYPSDLQANIKLYPKYLRKFVRSIDAKN